MNPIFTALQKGYTPEKILAYLQKMMPQMMPAVEKATKAGYSLKTILGFLSKNFETEDRRGLSESEMHAVNRRANAERAKFGLQMAGVAAASPIATSMASSAISRAIPSGLQQALGISPSAPLSPASPQMPPQSLAGQTQQQMPSLGNQPLSSQIPPVPSQPPLAPNAFNIAQSQQVPQPQANSIKAIDVLNKAQSVSKVDELAKAGNDAESITGFFRKFHPKIVQDVEKEAGKGFENVVSEYLVEKPKEAEIAPKIEAEEKEFEAPKIEKNSTVATPLGVGQVKELRNGQAIVEVDGKKHKISEDELIESPLPEKDLADLYDDLISGIEKKTGQQVSRNVDWAGYDPNTNELAYKPHGSDKLYAYGDISPEDVEQLTNLLTQRKSTGSNFIGAWEAGTTSPIGAAMYQLIQKLQKERGGKGSEYKNRYETIYEALEPAKSAAKKRHAERKKTKKPRAY